MKKPNQTARVYYMYFLDGQHRKCSDFINRSFIMTHITRHIHASLDPVTVVEVINFNPSTSLIDPWPLCTFQAYHSVFVTPLAPIERIYSKTYRNST